jgi:large subunit ribosomal protein L19e
MKLNLQKRIAASILKCSSNRIALDTTRLEDIKSAITKADIRNLINDGAIRKRALQGISRHRARIQAIKKKKGSGRGHGSRKGKKTARLPKKDKWMAAIRAQRAFLQLLKEKKGIEQKHYRNLYLKCKGGFFRSKRHIKLYIEEHKLGYDGKK